MAGIPSGEGRFFPNCFRLTLLLFSNCFGAFLGEMLSDLSDLTMDERMDALGKVRSVAFPVAILLQSFELSHEPYCRAFYNP